MIRHTTHWHAVRLVKRDVSEGPTLPSRLEKHFRKKIAERNSRSVSGGMLFRSRWYCCIIGVSASCIMEFYLPVSIEPKQMSGCDFLLKLN